MSGSVSRPLPLPDDLTRFYWEGAKQHKLLIQRCRQCGTYIHFPRPVCYTCLSTDLGPSEVSGRGTLYTYAIPQRAPHPGFANDVPYTTALVQLAEGPRMMTNIVECEQTPEKLVLDMPVEVVFEAWSDDLGDVWIPLFRPAAGDAT